MSAPPLGENLDPERSGGAAGLLASPFTPFGPDVLGGEQGARLRRFLRAYPQPLSGYTLAGLISWAEPFRYAWCFAEPGTLLVSSSPPAGFAERSCLLQPIGRFSEALQDALLARPSLHGSPLVFAGVCAAFRETFPRFCSRFVASESRDMANYIYAAADLAELGGRRYAKKRNLIAQARREYAWTVERLGPEQAPECEEVVDDIAVERRAEVGGTLEQETGALRRALHSFGELGLDGVLVRIDGRPAAFSIFEAMDATTAVVLFERARREFKGLSQVVNQQTARVIADRGFAWINREEDLGDPGLRQAKLSYHPVRLEMSYTLRLRT